MVQVGGLKSFNCGEINGEIFEKDRLDYLEFLFSSTLDPQSIFEHNNRHIDFKNLTIGSSFQLLITLVGVVKHFGGESHIWLSDFFKWFVWSDPSA